jgi:hypothetical protein
MLFGKGSMTCRDRCLQGTYTYIRTAFTQALSSSHKQPPTVRDPKKQIETLSPCSKTAHAGTEASQVSGAGARLWPSAPSLQQQKSNHGPTGRRQEQNNPGKWVRVNVSTGQDRTKYAQKEVEPLNSHLSQWKSHVEVEIVVQGPSFFSPEPLSLLFPSLTRMLAPEKRMLKFFSVSDTSLN